MTRIVHLITDLVRGGSETILEKLLARMDRSRFANVVVSMTSRGELAAEIVKAGVPVFSLGLTPKAPNPFGFIRLARLLRAHRPHILQTWLFHADLLGIIAGKLLGVPAVVWHVRCAALDRADHPLHLWATISILAKISALPDTVVTNSAAGRLTAERWGYGAKRWELIPNGFDLDVFRPSRKARMKLRQELSVANEALLVGLVARFDPIKDHETFLQAASTLHEEMTDVHFVLVGRGVDDGNRVLGEVISGLRLHGRVHLLGERVDIPDVTASLDIATCSSYSEGFPNVLGEAMACGVPCVTTDVGDCAKILGDSGIVVPLKDSAAMAAAWKKLLSFSDGERVALGMKARERIASLFGITDMVRRYEALYDEIRARTAHW